MKIIVTFLAMLPALFLFAGNQEEVEKTKENKPTIMELTKDEFIKRVYNYETNPKEWKYEGDKPCIIDFTQHGVLPVKCWLLRSKRSTRNTRDRSMFIR